MTPLDKLIDHYPALSGCLPDIEAVIHALCEGFARGNKLLLCGNGGSASDADHIAGELLKGFQSRRPLTGPLRASLGNALADKLQGALPAIPLSNFAALNSAYLNDVDGEYAYAQLVLGLGAPGDLLLGLSTSGNAKNVGHALRVARAKGLITLGFTGRHGGAMVPLCDYCIRVPADETYRIQEFHLPIYHAICLMVERRLFPVS